MYNVRNISKGLMASLIIGVIIAFFISIIPNTNLLGINKSFPVINLNEKVNLSDANIVDFMVPFSNKMKITQVNWEKNKLSVDYKIGNNNNFDTSVIYKEFYDLIKKSFVEVGNINGVLLRVFLNDNNMFVAISASKEDISTNLNMQLSSSENYKIFLEKYFGLNYGNLLK